MGPLVGPIFFAYICSMKRKVTVIVYTRSTETVGHRIRSNEIYFWESRSKVANKILWELIKENESKTESEVITGVQVI